MATKSEVDLAHHRLQSLLNRSIVPPDGFLRVDLELLYTEALKSAQEVASEKPA